MILIMGVKWQVWWNNSLCTMHLQSPSQKPKSTKALILQYGSHRIVNVYLTNKTAKILNEKKAKWKKKRKNNNKVFNDSNENSVYHTTAKSLTAFTLCRLWSRSITLCCIWNDSRACKVTQKYWCSLCYSISQRGSLDL